MRVRPCRRDCSTTSGRRCSRDCSTSARSLAGRARRVARPRPRRGTTPTRRRFPASPGWWSPAASSRRCCSMLGLERVSGLDGLAAAQPGGTVHAARSECSRCANTSAAVRGSGRARCSRLRPRSLRRARPAAVTPSGFVLIGAACLGWAIDNNLTQRLSVRDPFQIVAVKTGVAAFVNVGLAAARGEGVGALAPLAGALALGALAYGASILLDAYALRFLGAARESAMFATAPFAGALLAVPLLGDSWGAIEIAAAVVMAVGVAMLDQRSAHAHACPRGARPRPPARARRAPSASTPFRRRPDRTAQSSAPSRTPRARASARVGRPSPPRPPPLTSGVPHGVAPSSVP